MGALIVFGAAGQLGSALVRAARSADIDVAALAHGDADIAREDDVARALDAVARARAGRAGGRLCTVAVNAAAWTDVDRAETAAAAAHAVNARGAGIVAVQCAARGIALLHISTDYIFDGESRAAYVEDDPPRPVNVYGASKLAGETAVRDAGPRHVILRCSTLFGARGRNFLTAVVRRARQHGSVRVPVDQRSSPTPLEAAAGAALRLVGEIERRGESMPFGTYHFGGEPAASRYEFAQAIVDAAGELGLPPPRLEAAAREALRSAAKRPAFSVLDGGKIRRTFGIASPDWRAALKPTVAALLAGGDSPEA